MVVALLEQIKRNPNDYPKWLELCHQMVAAGALKEFREIITYRNSLGLSGINLAHDVMIQLAYAENRRALYSLFETFPDNDPFSGAFYLGKAYINFLDFDLEAGLSLLRLGCSRCLSLQQSYPVEKIDRIGNITLNAFLFEPEGWKGTGEPFDTPLDIVTETTIPQETAYHSVFFCDSVYFCHYAERFISSFRQNCGDNPIFVGIVNPDADALALARKLAERFAPVTIAETRYAGDKLAEYCTAIRFLYANDLIRRFNAPTLFFDADAYFPKGSGDALRKIAEYPLAYIDTRDLLPNLTIDASVVGAHPGQESMLFFDIVCHFIIDKMAEEGPLWTIDQVALYRAVSIGKKNKFSLTDVRHIELNGIKLPSFFKEEHDIFFDSRVKTRTNSNVYLVGLNSDGKPIFQKNT